MPIRIHELLLSLAGQLDDDALADARQMLASAELDRSLEFVAGCLAAGEVVLSGPQHREIEELFANTYLDPSVIDRVVAHDNAPTYRHRFAVGAVDGEEPDRGVAEAIRPVLDVLPDVRSVWCVWRLTPSGPVSGPVPHRLVLIGVGPAGFAPATAYRVEYALRRAGIRASVEVLVDGGQPTDYHQEAMRCARQVPFDDPGPGSGGGRPPVSPVEPVRAEPFTAEPASAGAPARARATMRADSDTADGPVVGRPGSEPVPSATARPVGESVSSATARPGAGATAMAEAGAEPGSRPAPMAELRPDAEAATETSVAAVPVAGSRPGTGAEASSSVEPVAGLGSDAGLEPVAETSSGADPMAELRPGLRATSAPELVAGAELAAEPRPGVGTVPTTDARSGVESMSTAEGRPGAASAGLSSGPEPVPVGGLSSGAESVPVAGLRSDEAAELRDRKGQLARPEGATRDYGTGAEAGLRPGAELQTGAEAEAGAVAAAAELADPKHGSSPEPTPVAQGSEATAVFRPVSVAGGGSNRDQTPRAGSGAVAEPPAQATPVAEPMPAAHALPVAEAVSAAHAGPVAEPVPAAQVGPVVERVPAGQVGPVAESAPGAELRAGSESLSFADLGSGSQAGGNPAESASVAELRTGSESLPAADLSPRPQAQPAPVAEVTPFRQVASVGEAAESKRPSPFPVEPPKVDSVRPARPRPVESIKSVFEQEGAQGRADEQANLRPSPRRRQRGQDEPASRPRLVPASPPAVDPPAEPPKDRHAAAFVDEMLNTQERNLLRELQDELARREKQENQNGPWRSGRHGKPFEPGQVAVNGVPPRHDRGYGSA